MGGSPTLLLLLLSALLCGAVWSPYNSGSLSAGVPLNSSICNIEKRDTLSVEEFNQNYKKNRIPVIIKRDSSTNSLFHQMCQQEYLLQYYPNVSVTLSTANTFSYKKKKSSSIPIHKQNGARPR